MRSFKNQSCGGRAKSGFGAEQQSVFVGVIGAGLREGRSQDGQAPVGQPAHQPVQDRQQGAVREQPGNRSRTLQDDGAFRAFDAEPTPGIVQHQGKEIERTP